MLVRSYLGALRGVGVERLSRFRMRLAVFVVFGRERNVGTQRLKEPLICPCGVREECGRG
jgi:hypothetical protein